MKIKEEKRVEKRLEDWKTTLWEMWDAGGVVKGDYRKVSFIKAAFMAGFDSGRASVKIIPPMKKPKRRIRKVPK